MSEWWEQYKVDVPEGQSGDWRVMKFEISKKEADFQNVRATFSFSDRGTYTYPGKFTKLMRGGVLVMSDTADEIKDHLGFIRDASGNVLIAGLGLGMVADAVLKKPDVKQVTVIELSPDVIRLVGSHWQPRHGDRLHIIQADILQWKPPKDALWDHAWYDIWDDKSETNLKQMTQLKRKFARKVGEQGCWAEDTIRYWARRNRNAGW